MASFCTTLGKNWSTFEFFIWSLCALTTSDFIFQSVLKSRFLSRTSSEEASTIQVDTDEVIKKWKHFVRILAENKTPAMSKDVERLVNWVDTSLVKNALLWRHI